MKHLIVKNVDIFGDTIMAAQDNNGTIWVGVRWMCQGMGMTDGQYKRQITNIQNDLLLKGSGSNLILNKGSGEREVFCIKLDYLPMWLAKITITEKTRKDRPEFADKLLQYQLKAKDILAAAFLPINSAEITAPVSPSEIPLGELASYLKAMDRVAHRQNLAPHKIAENFKKVSAQFGVQLTEDFVAMPEYEQLTLTSMVEK